MPQTTFTDKLELAEAIAETLATRVGRNDPTDAYFIMEDFRELGTVLEGTVLRRGRGGTSATDSRVPKPIGSAARSGPPATN